MKVVYIWRDDAYEQLFSLQSGTKEAAEGYEVQLAYCGFKLLRAVSERSFTLAIYNATCYIINT